ncbi:S-adenosyl-L-methionine-dependent methyltransferase [Serendipita vermifera]|nr:S-adenosyl-L-methionine-dependent methyltransferase [Serendipita vermifera]
MNSDNKTSPRNWTKEEALCKTNQPPAVRARYEQPFPGHSQQVNERAGRTIAPTSIMDHSHDATTNEEAAQSTYSYESTRDWAMFFKEIDGRIFSSQASTYILPADEVEFLRLDKQHATHLIGLGDLYSCPDLVEQVLSPEPRVTKEILDLGCGTGIWALSMARQFPHARVVGVDLAPAPLREDQLPPNIEFEIDDINLGLGHFAGRFDVVHMRCLGGGLPDINQGITNAARYMVTTQKVATPNQKDSSWVRRFFYEAMCAFELNGTNAFKVVEVMDTGLWGHPFLTSCGAASMFNPIGPWATSTDPEESQRLQFAGILNRQNLKGAMRALQTLLKKNGVPEAIIGEFITLADNGKDLPVTWPLLNLTYLYY